MQSALDHYTHYTRYLKYTYFKRSSINIYTLIVYVLFLTLLCASDLIVLNMQGIQNRYNLQ